MISIINYGVGNLTSILNMFKHLGLKAQITNERTKIDQSDKLLLPGIGHFDTCMKNFNDSGLRAVVEKKVFEDKIPTLGICVGAQMMTYGSDEGQEKGLNWIEGKTIKFNSLNLPHLKIPHIGWGDISIVEPNVLFNDLPEPSRFYFAHSYHFELKNYSNIIATSNYGYNFHCAFQTENIFGVQFHPEKSHKFGMKVLTNFAEMQI